MVSLLSAKIYSWIGDRRCFDFDSFDEIFLLLYLLLLKFELIDLTNFSYLLKTGIDVFGTERLSSSG